MGTTKSVLETSDNDTILGQKRSTAIATLSKNLAETNASFNAATRTIVAERKDHYKKLHLQRRKLIMKDIELQHAREKCATANRRAIAAERSAHATRDYLARVDAARCGARHGYERALEATRKESVYALRKALQAERASARARESIADCDKARTDAETMRRDRDRLSACKDNMQLRVDASDARNETIADELKMLQESHGFMSDEFRRTQLRCTVNEDSLARTSIRLKGLKTANDTLALELSHHKNKIIATEARLKLTLKRLVDTDFTNQIVRAVCGDELPNHTMKRNFRFAHKLFEVFHTQNCVPAIHGRRDVAEDAATAPGWFPWIGRD